MPFIIITIFLFVFIPIYGIIDQVHLLMLVNGIIALYQIVDKAMKQKLSIAFTHWFFIFIFFFIIPYIQYSTDSYRYISSVYFKEELLFTEIIILIWIIIFILFYNLNFRNSSLKISFLGATQNLTKKLTVLNLLLIINGLIALFYIINFGVDEFLIRGKNDEMIWSTFGSKSTGLLFMRGFRPFTLHLFLISSVIFVYKKRFIINRNIIIILGLIGLLFNFPTGNSRFYAFVVMMMLYALLFMKPSRKGLIFIPLMVLGMFGSLWINQFRDMQSLNEITMEVETDRIFAGDYDTFETMVIGVRYVDNNGLSYGRNILGAVLFFVPRAIWPTKPVGTGFYLVTTLSNIPGLEFYNKNLAFPFMGELYFAFGIIGVVFGAILFGSIFGTLDKYYFLNFFRKDKEFRLFLIFYSGLFAFILFIMRGDLINSVAYFTGFTVAYWFALRVLGIRIRIRRIS